MIDHTISHHTRYSVIATYEYLQIEGRLFKIDFEEHELNMWFSIDMQD